MTVGDDTRACRPRRGLWAAAAAALAAAVYMRSLRRRILTWGATPAEAEAVLPGDDRLADADGVATRAVTIAAAPSDVWPWLAQMGPVPRGGAYSYDWIENLLGLDMHSTDRVLREFQHPQPGDTIGYGTNAMRVEIADPERCLAWRSEDGNWVWTFVLDGHGDRTRLISRNRFRLPSAAARLGMLALEPASLIMERKMLKGIRRRAEQLAREPGSQADSQASDTTPPVRSAPAHEPPRLDPDAPPAPANVEHRSPSRPYKDQGDPLATAPRR